VNQVSNEKFCKFTPANLPCTKNERERIGSKKLRRRLWVKGRKRWFLLALILIVIIAVVVARREPTIVPGSFLVVDIGGRYVEAQPSGFMAQLLGSQEHVFIDLLLELRKAIVDHRLKGVIVRIQPVELDFAQVQELRNLFSALQKSGKRVIAWVAGESSSGNTAYFLASAAEQVFFAENTVLPLTGLRATYLFLGGLWKHLDVELQVEQIREYKTFGDFLSRQTMSEAHREMANSLLDSLQDQFVSGISEARGLSPDQVRALIDAPTLTAADFQQGGLINGIRYFDEVLEELSPDASRPIQTVSLATYRRVKPTSVGLGGEEKIAIIYGVGAVTTGESDWGITGQAMGADTIVEAFADAGEDDRIKAIIFRIDSPGGSALASDLIWRAVDRAKRNKPVIVSMSGVAGSGGYYIATGASKIVAQPATLTGSIGIVFMQPNIQGLLENYGVNTETLSRGAYARLFDPSKSWTTQERQQIKRILEDLYLTFTRKVAEGRGLSVDEVDLVGRGRVWTGVQAKERHLVDELGGIDTALRLAKQAIGLAAESGVQLVFYPKSKPFLELLIERFSGQVVEGFAWPEPVAELQSLLRPLTRLGRGPLYAMPAIIRLR
jgi:protease-4